MKVGDKVILKSSGSGMYVKAPPSKTIKVMKGHFIINVYTKPPTYEVNDLMYQPWISHYHSKAFAVGIGQYWRAIRWSGNSTEGNIMLDENGDLWFWRGSVASIKKDDWSDKSSPYYNTGISGCWSYKDFLVANDKILVIDKGTLYDCGIYNLYVGYPRMFNKYTGELIWEANPSDEIPCDYWEWNEDFQRWEHKGHCYVAWDVSKGKVILGGWQYAKRWWESGGIVEKIGVYNDSTGERIWEYSEIEFWGGSPKRRKYVILLNENSGGRYGFVYWEGNTIEIRDESFNLVETQSFSGTLPGYQLGNTPSKRIINGTLTDLETGDTLKPPYISLGSGIDSGLSWHSIWGGAQPNIQAIYDYVLSPDDINRIFGI